MNPGRIQKRFAGLAAEGRKALLAYIVAGDPDLSTTLAAMHALVRGGADVIELGMPFTDPEAEGPVIQAAHERALKNRVSLRAVLDLVAEFRRRDSATAVLLMGYLNPIEQMGYQAFAKEAKAKGLDAALLVNLPPEESGLLREAMAEEGLDMIHLLAPTTGEQRAAEICASASGFVYCVSLTGVTGADTLDVQQVAERLLPIRKHLGGLPVVVGFGVRDAGSAAALAGIADGVVVGSVLVDLFRTHEKTELPEVLCSVTRGFREALDRGP